MQPAAEQRDSEEWSQRERERGRGKGKRIKRSKVVNNHNNTPNASPEVRVHTCDLSRMNWHCGRDSGLSEKLTRAFSASERTTKSIDS